MPISRLSNEIAAIKASLLGDRRAFGQLVQAYGQPLLHFFYLQTGDEELSKDLLQDSLIKAWQHLDSFRFGAKFSTWLYRIGYNTLVDYRRRAALDTVELSKAVVEDSGSTPPCADMDFMALLSPLSDIERTVCILYFKEDKTIKSIARIMNLNLNTVKSHFMRGKKKIEDYLVKHPIR